MKGQYCLTRRNSFHGDPVVSQERIVAVGKLEGGCSKKLNARRPVVCLGWKQKLISPSTMLSQKAN
jgi:hypothetical protein